MKPLLFLIIVTLSAILLLAQRPPMPDRPADRKLPDGRSQNEEILKSEHEKSLKDVGDLMKLSEELKIELEKNDRHVLSVSMLKKTEEIEKLAKRIRGRLRRF